MDSVSDNASAQLPFRFRVREAFTIAGRGTSVIGYIEQGTIKVGDSLRLIRRDGARIVTCQGISWVRDTNWQPGDPAPMGMLLPELEPEDLIADDLLEAD